jgi:hypothetical protein
MNKHPDLKYEDNDQPWVAERHYKEITQQPTEHIGEPRQRSDGWQQSLNGRKPPSGVMRPIYGVGRHDYS